MGSGPVRCAARLLATMLAAVSVTASAAQFFDARGGDTAIARMSIKAQTRIRLERGRIGNVIGDACSKDRNPAGRLFVIADEEDCELYVRPVDGGVRPVKVDLRTDRGKFSLLLQPVDMPGDTLVLPSRGIAVSAGTAQTTQNGEFTAAATLPLAQATAIVERNSAV